MRRIEGPPVGRISESIHKGGRIKGVPVLKAPNIALVREAEEKGFIQELPIRQQEVIKRRYPRDGNPGSLSVIGDDLNLTRERVRQREAQAFKNIQRLKEGKPPFFSGNTREDVNVDEVVRLYVEEGKTYEEIVKQLDCGYGTVKKRLDLARTPRRREGARRKEVNINLLVWQYIVEGMSATEIAEPLGVSYKTVLNRLREAECQIRLRGPRKK